MQDAFSTNGYTIDEIELLGVNYGLVSHSVETNFTPRVADVYFGLSGEYIGGIPKIWAIGESVEMGEYFANYLPDTLPAEGMLGFSDRWYGDLFNYSFFAPWLTNAMPSTNFVWGGDVGAGIFETMDDDYLAGVYRQFVTAWPDSSSIGAGDIQDASFGFLPEGDPARSAYVEDDFALEAQAYNSITNSFLGLSHTVTNFRGDGRGEGPFYSPIGLTFAANDIPHDADAFRFRYVDGDGQVNESFTGGVVYSMDSYEAYFHLKVFFYITNNAVRQFMDDIFILADSEGCQNVGLLEIPFQLSSYQFIGLATDGEIEEVQRYNFELMGSNVLTINDGGSYDETSVSFSGGAGALSISVRTNLSRPSFLAD